MVNRLPVFFDIYDRLNSIKIKELQEAIDDNDMPESEKAYLIQLKVNKLFTKATGLNVDNQMREYVIYLMNKLSLNEKAIKPIFVYIQKQNGIHINISKVEWLCLYFCHIIFKLNLIILGVIPIVIIILLIVYKPYLDSIIISMIELSIVFGATLLMTFFFMYEAKKYYLLDKIYREDCSLFIGEVPSRCYKMIVIFVIFVIFPVVYLLSDYTK